MGRNHRGRGQRRHATIDEDVANPATSFRLGPRSVTVERPVRRGPFSNNTHRPCGFHPNQRQFSGPCHQELVCHTITCSHHNILIRTKRLKDLFQALTNTMRDIEESMEEDTVDKDKMDWQPELAVVIPVTDEVAYCWGEVPQPRSDIRDFKKGFQAVKSIEMEKSDHARESQWVSSYPQGV